MGGRLNMRRAIQTQNDEVGFESVRGQQDLFTRYPELDQEFWLDCLWGMPQSEFLELSLTSHSGLVLTHLVLQTLRLSTASALHGGRSLVTSRSGNTGDSYHSQSRCTFPKSLAK